MKLTLFDLTTTDPAFNLAAEQYIFDALPRDRMYFMLWQNDNAVIIGKHQNTRAEINEKYVKEHGVRVVRRLSGGGAVYHDLGNLNFTFITDAREASEMNFRVFCEPVVRTLARFGVTAEINGRNDMTIAGKKFSGNAQYVKDGRVMHHGTILFDSDLAAVSEALRADEEKYKTKAFKSVRSRVTNVAEHLPQPVPLAEFRAALLAEAAKSAPAEPGVFTDADLAAIEALRAERYATYEWNYGAAGTFTMQRRARIEGCGTIEVHFRAEGGVIAEARFFGDFSALPTRRHSRRASSGRRRTKRALRRRSATLMFQAVSSV